jgi:multiple sugar transport system permease protein
MTVAVSTTSPAMRPARRPNYRLPRQLAKAGSAMLGIVLLIWWLLPVYNMVLIAIDPTGTTEFAGYIWPPAPTLEAFDTVLFQGYWYLRDFWRQFGNSIYIGFATMVLTAVISSLAAFALGRMRLSRGWIVSNAALLIYAVPAYFLIIPYFRLMHTYGLMDNLWAIVAINVTFTAPYALLILQWYGRLIPIELDEAARIDGATPLQVYATIYVPLMAPALATVATYALLVSWNEFLYQFLLLNSPGNKTVAITIAEFFENDDSPWNLMVAAGLIYSLPPIAIFFALRRYMASGLTMGAVKG